MFSSIFQIALGSLLFGLQVTSSCSKPLNIRIISIRKCEMKPGRQISLIFVLTKWEVSFSCKLRHIPDCSESIWNDAPLFPVLDFVRRLQFPRAKCHCYPQLHPRYYNKLVWHGLTCITSRLGGRGEQILNGSERWKGERWNGWDNFWTAFMRRKLKLGLYTNQSISGDLKLFDCNGGQYSVRVQIPTSYKMFESQQISVSHEIHRLCAVPARRHFVVSFDMPLIVFVLVCIRGDLLLASSDFFWV